jgi:hypothetical protein
MKEYESVAVYLVHGDDERSLNSGAGSSPPL